MSQDGIKGYTEVAPDFLSLARNGHTQQEIVKMVADRPLDFQPGEKWEESFWIRPSGY